jgi:translocation and assembly module TamA
MPCPPPRRPDRALRLLLALVAAAPLSAGCLRARGTPEEPVITELRFEGVRAIDRDDLVEKLATQETSRRSVFLFFLFDVARLDPDALAADRRRVEAYYRERGYYGARVADVEVKPDGRGRARIVFRVEEGEPVRVRSVAVEGLEEVTAAGVAAPDLPLRTGEVFTEGDYDAAAAALRETLRRHGWANGEVRQGARVIPEEGAAEVTYVLEPGPRYRFGPVFVAGTGSIPRGRVREQAAREVKPGAWYDESKLDRARARVFDLGVFGGVRVTRGAPDPASGSVPVVVAVREAPPRTLQAGPGIGLAASRWDASLLAGWTHRNFLGDLRRLSVEGRAGYAWLPNPFTPEKEGAVGILATEFSQPGAFTRWLDASARLELERGLEQGYDFWSERLRLALPIRLSPRWRLVPSYNLEVYQLRNIPQLQQDLSQPGSPLNQGCEASPDSRRAYCVLSYLEQQLGWDGRDDAVNTRRGYFLGLSLQEGFRLGGFGYQYLRVLPEARAFLPLGSRAVLAARARVGALVPLGENQPPPLIALFSSGGPLSQRGYYTGRLSPMVLEGSDWVPTGGNGLADGSLELRLSSGGPWGYVLFLDGGNVSERDAIPSAWQGALDPTLIQYALGVGLRYRTPFGPLRIDTALRLPTDLRDDVTLPHRFPTVPGASQHREPWLAVHLSLGEAF